MQILNLDNLFHKKIMVLPQFLFRLITPFIYWSNFNAFYKITSSTENDKSFYKNEEWKSNILFMKEKKQYDYLPLIISLLFKRTFKYFKIWCNET